MPQQLAGHLLVDCLIAQGVLTLLAYQVKVIWPYLTDCMRGRAPSVSLHADRKAAQLTWLRRMAS